LELSGVPIEDFQIKLVKVGEFNNQNVNIRTTICSPIKIE
jgi:hypothetical protein